MSITSFKLVAKGKQLDMFGKYYGIPRKKYLGFINEPDRKYRARMNKIIQNIPKGVFRYE